MTGLTHPCTKFANKTIVAGQDIQCCREVLFFFFFYPYGNMYFYKPINRLQTFKQVPVMTKAVRGSV